MPIKSKTPFKLIGKDNLCH